MTFEIYTKGRTWISSIEKDIVSVAKTSISLGEEVVAGFGEDKFVEVYLDRKNNKVGFKPTSSSVTGFRLSKKNKGGRMTFTGKFLDLLPQGQFKAKEEDGFMVIQVPEIAAENKTVKVK